MGVAEGARLVMATANKALLGYITVCFIVAVMTLVDGLRKESTMALLGGVYMLHCGFEYLIGCIGGAAALVQSTNQLPFAMARLEVLLTYANGCVLIFFCLSMFVEGSERLLAQHQTPQSVTLIFTQLALHFVYETTLNKAVILKPLSGRLMARCMVGGMSLISWMLVELFSWYKMDICMGLVTAVMCSFAVWPEQRRCADILLQKAPSGLRPALDKAVKEAEATDGVLEITDQRYWSIRYGEVVGTFKVRTREGSEVAAMEPAIKAPFTSLVTSLTVQFEPEHVSSIRQDLSLLQPAPFEPPAPSSPNSSSYSHTYQNVPLSPLGSSRNQPTAQSGLEAV